LNPLRTNSGLAEEANIRTGYSYQTIVNPPPADPAAAHRA